MFQLMEDGVGLTNGPSALLFVEKEPRPGPEPATTLPQITVELLVRDKARILNTAILLNAQVK